jgi:hypothetical protein
VLELNGEPLMDLVLQRSNGEEAEIQEVLEERLMLSFVKVCFVQYQVFILRKNEGTITCAFVCVGVV